MMITSKPKKPSSYILVTRTANYYFDFVSNKHALGVFMDWIKKSVPKGAKDVTIGLGEEFYYDDSNTWIQLEWKEKRPNTKYFSQMKKYKKQLEKWNKQWQ